MDPWDGIIVLLACLTASTCVDGQGLSITIAPKNVAQYVGQDVEMECEFSTNTFILTWSECISNPDRCTLFNTDGASQPVPDGGDRYDRYSTINRSSGSRERYDLLITGTQLEDGGRFKCGDITNTVESYAEVIALDGVANCSRDLTTPDEVEAGSEITMTCFIGYQGRWYPKMIFTDSSDTVIVDVTMDQSTTGTIQYTARVTATKDHQDEVFSMQAMFDEPTNPGTDAAANAPDYPSPDTYNYPPLSVWYPPESEGVSSEGPYYLGETITAMADGNPVPTDNQYQWTDMNNTDTALPAGPNLVVTEAMLDVTSYYQCKICNTYFSQDHCVDLPIFFTAFVNAPLSPGAIAGIAVGCAVVVILAIVLVVVCCMRKKKAQQSKDSRHPAHGPPRVHGDAVRQPDIVNNKPGPYPDEKVGYAPYDQQGPYSNPVGSPYSDVEQPDDVPATSNGVGVKKGRGKKEQTTGSKL